MPRNRTVIFAIIALVYGLVLWSLPFILPEETVATLVVEDSVPEYLTAIFFLTSGIAWLLAFIYSRKGNDLGFLRTRRNYIYLALALILLFGGLEEISWGQRIFGFETPAFMQHNEQGELSIHNLPQFNTTNIGNLFTMNRLFLFFWFGLGILIPLSALFVEPLRKLYNRLGVPIFPIILGAQFLLNYILSKLYNPLGANREIYDGRLSELRESMEALLFALIAIGVLLDILAARRAKAQPELEARPARAIR